MERSETRKQMPLTPQDVWKKLREDKVFANFTSEEFSAMMSLLQIESVPDGTILLMQNGSDPNLYVIRRGRVAIRAAVPGGIDPISEWRYPGDLLNITSFLTGKLNDFTVEAADDLEVWMLPGNDFRAMKADWSGLEEKIVYPDDAKAFITATKLFDDQRPGERVLWQSKKHWWVFAGNAGLAWLTFIVLAALSLIGWQWAILGIFLQSTIGTFLWTGAMVIAVGIAIWHFVDWQNDYYVVTDQRVIHRERVFLVYDQQDECPIGKVQNVNVRRTSWVSSIFDIGDVSVETLGARGNVEFRWVHTPDAAAKAILNQASQGRVVNQATERIKIRTTIRREMRMSAGEHVPRTESTYKPKSDAAPHSLPFSKRLRAGLAKVRYAFVPAMREVQGNDIIYHKHWLQLLQSTGFPLANLLLYSIGLIALPFVSTELARLAFRSLLVIPVIVLGLVVLAWLIWCYEDWRNDTYILKLDRVIDSDRSPFGLMGTQQKTAGMGNIQNVAYTTRGVLDTVFNVGDVTIQTGGADGELVFERVWNPRRVQRDIVDRLEVFQNTQREYQAEARRREIAEWLGIYDELARMHDRKKLG